MKRAGENGSLAAELAEKEEELNKLRDRVESLETDMKAYNNRKLQMKQWFIDMLDAADNTETDSSSNNSNVTLKMKIRGNDSPNVRKQPSISGKVVGHASPSAEYEVLDVFSGAWFQIRLENGNTGWISSKMGVISELQFDFETEDGTELPAESEPEKQATPDPADIDG